VGARDDFDRLVGLLDDFGAWFPIVEP
jgi:hypothetical protein